MQSKNGICCQVNWKQYVLSHFLNTVSNAFYLVTELLILIFPLSRVNGIRVYATYFFSIFFSLPLLTLYGPQWKQILGFFWAFHGNWYPLHYLHLLFRFYVSMYFYTSLPNTIQYNTNWVVLVTKYPVINSNCYKRNLYCIWNI